MASITDSNPYSAGVLGAIKGALGLFKDINKTPSVGDQSVTPMDEYESSYSEEDIIGLTKQWRKEYDGYYADVEKTQNAAFDYWIGKQKQDSVDTLEGRDYVDNLIFEALETFLPMATRANPDPLVSADNSEEGQALAKDVKDALVFQASPPKQNLRMKLKSVVRNWALMRIGVIEVGYDYEKDDISTTVINSKRCLFDTKGHIDEYGYFRGDWFGVRYEFSASKLVAMFPQKAQVIREKAMDKKGTKLEIIKWWYKGTDVFFTLDEKVLAKKKNPHWNYDGEIKRIDPTTGTEIATPIQGKNHFPAPMLPYVFLGIFKTGTQPHDDTSLILQNLSIQDLINKRYRQIDKNVDSQNNGIIVNGNMMTQEQAAEAASAKRRGAAIRVMGNPNEVIKTDGAPALPPDIWNSLRDNREQLKNIFGISGATPSGIQKEDTARGKILVNQLDTSRIGGGITEYIEQIASSVYNLWVQMMYVHYDAEHYISMVGVEQGAEMAFIKNTRFTKTLTVSVKEGSLIPKDPLTERNEAIDLWSANAIDPISLYKKLDFPDPMGAAKQLVIWQMVQKGVMPPQMYIPDFQMPPAQLPGAMNPPGTPQAPGVGDTSVNPMGAATPPTQTMGQQLLGQIPVQ